MSRRFILALDQGTTGTNCLVLDPALQIVGRAALEAAACQTRDVVSRTLTPASGPA